MRVKCRERLTHCDRSQEKDLVPYILEEYNYSRV